MTEFDEKLIEKANGFRRWDYRNIDVLISIADTEKPGRGLPTYVGNFTTVFEKPYKIMQS